MQDELLEAIDSSDVEKASSIFLRKMQAKEDALKVHNSLFPVVQKVLNPPFINPHLPKMYSICRELFPYLEEEEVPGLVKLEVNEYAGRIKMKAIPKGRTRRSPTGFSDLESTIRNRDVNGASELLSSIYASGGKDDISRELMLIGSGYLNNSLGHSISCTAFILREMVERPDQDPWPALSTLANYFCAGQFSKAPKLDREAEASPKLDFTSLALQAVSGRGIVNLHHTITLYAIERMRPLFTSTEYAHLLKSFTDFMGNKSVKPFSIGDVKEAPETYSQFHQLFQSFDSERVVAALSGLFNSDLRRRQLGRFLIKGICDLYMGEYDPHFVTGLGSVLWLIEKYWNEPPIATTGLYQYIDYYFTNN